MARNNHPGSSVGGGKPSPQAQAREQEKRAENAEKSRRMGNIYLCSILAVVGVFCAYTLIRTLFFPAESVSALRTNYLFISLVALPDLILTAAVAVRRLRKKARDRASDSVRRAEQLLFLLTLVCALSMFGAQMLRGRTDVSGHKASAAFTEALGKSGMTVQVTEEASGFRSILEAMSIESRAVCGDTTVTLNYHEGGSGVLRRFRQQAEHDYSDFGETRTEVNGVAVSLWANADRSEAIAAICAHTDQAVLILELVGPEAQAEALRPLLLEAAGSILGND